MAIIQRSPADKPGEDIVNAILVSDTSQIERGTQEINYNSTDRVLKTGVVVSTDYVEPGIIVELQDKSGSSRGMVTGFSLVISASEGRISLSTNLEVECVK